MRRQTGVSWCDHTFNGWIGCTKLSPGCTNCYAETIAARFWQETVWGPKATRKLNSETYWAQPHRWNRRAKREQIPRLIFSGSMCDIFEEHPVADATRPRLWTLIADTPHLTWLLLAKRPERIADHLPQGWPWPHCWLGVSVENQRYANERIPILLSIPAAHRFLSCEPLLGPLDLERYLTHEVQTERGVCVSGGAGGRLDDSPGWDHLESTHERTGAGEGSSCQPPMYPQESRKSQRGITIRSV